MNQESAAIQGLIGSLVGILGGVGALLVARKARAEAWDPLHARFPSTTPDIRGELRFKSLAVRLNPFACLHFGFCTALKITDASIHIRIQGLPAFLGAFFRPIDLPWSAIESVELKHSIIGHPMAWVRIKGYTPLLTFDFMPARMIHEEWTKRHPKTD